MILPVASASLSISSHSMTCKLQNSVPSPLSLAPVSGARSRACHEASPAPGLAASPSRENLASQTFAIFDHFFCHASIITIQWLDAKQILAKNCVP